MNASLLPFFSPKGVAVIGVSQDPTKLGYGLARNLVLSNFQGAVHFVNPKGGNLFGRPIYPNLAQVPDPVDLAYILIPAEAVSEALHLCANRGIHAAVIGSGGFRETGQAGAVLEDEILRIARQNDIRLIGPNSVGLLDTHLPINATFLPPPGPLPGDVAFISHSGAICAAVIDWARGQSFGLSRLVSLGNQANVSETDVLALVASDPYTRVLTLYLEGVRDGRRFVEEASQVSRQKPVIALKVGRFGGGQRAVASHTGALAGSENSINAAFRRAGVIRADTSEEMFDWARTLAWCKPPRGRAVAVLTNAGGPGAAASDALEANGLELAILNQATHVALTEILPPAASLGNPIDMLASASPELYAACLRILLADDGVHSVLVVLPPPPMYAAGAVAKSLIPVIHASEKPVVVALMGEKLIQEAVEHLRAARVPEYRFPERAASSLATLAQRAEYLHRLDGTRDTPSSAMHLPGASSQSVSLSGIDRLAVDRLIANASGWLAQDIALQVLQAYGIPVLKAAIARSANVAAGLARDIGFPVALKISSPDIAHKSDLGGVLLNLHSEEQVTDAYQRMLDKIIPLLPQASFQGVLIQAMAPSGQDVIVGSVQDAQFGPLVMFGSGGVEVEGLKDVSFGLAPLPIDEAEAMLESTWAGRKLHGYRNLPPADRPATLDVLFRLSQLAIDFPVLSEIEINPLRVLPAGQGALALDARIKV
jgi:acetyltransferase